MPKKSAVLRDLTMSQFGSWMTEYDLFPWKDYAFGRAPELELGAQGKYTFIKAFAGYNPHRRRYEELDKIAPSVSRLQYILRVDGNLDVFLTPQTISRPTIVIPKHLRLIEGNLNIPLMRDHIVSPGVETKISPGDLIVCDYAYFTEIDGPVDTVAEQSARETFHNSDTENIILPANLTKKK